MHFCTKVEKNLQDEFSKKLEEKEQNLKQVQEDNQKMLDNWMKEREDMIQKQLEEERKVSYFTFVNCGHLNIFLLLPDLKIL